MFNPYRVPFPMPKSSPAHGALSRGEKRYSFPIPSEELHPEFTWPKSLCHFAEQCPVSDDFSDIDKAEECVHAHKFGCPIFLTEAEDFDEFGECKNIKIFEIGQVESKDYTEKDLGKIVANFEKLSKTHKPPLVVLGHGENQELLQQSGLPAAGWISALRLQGKRLLADFKEVPKMVVQAIKNGAYKFPSVEIYRNFVFGDVEHGPVLRRVALLGADIPRIKSLGDVVARYEESNDDKGLLFPVIQSGSNDDNQSIWLGGETIMTLLQIKPVKVNGKFKVGEAVSGDKSDFRGTLESFADDNTLTITITAGKDLTTDEKIIGADSKAVAELSEPKPELVEQTYTIDTKGGPEFKPNEKVFFDDKKELFAIVKNAEKNKLVIMIGKELVSQLASEGTVTGELSTAKATYPYPPPYKKEPPEKSDEVSALKDELQTLKATLEQERQNRIALEQTTASYEERIAVQEQNRIKDKRTQHLKDVDTFCEGLKIKGLAPAIIDEDKDEKLGLKRYAKLLDWQGVIKFGEGDKAVEKTPYELFSEMITRMVDLHAEGKPVFIPLDKIGKTEEELQAGPAPEGVDEESVLYDKQIQAFSEKHEISYGDSLKVHEEAKVKNRTPVEVAVELISGFKTKKAE